ncbi:hypothetical protein BC830DRAFT_1138934 [Chytriomyces sp. MP71]|nr:hypothetical protein BC830DRAFT_1138934 [Chytriomyces sp. MP71]
MRSAQAELEARCDGLLARIDGLGSGGIGHLDRVSTLVKAERKYLSNSALTSEAGLLCSNVAFFEALVAIVSWLGTGRLRSRSEPSPPQDTLNTAARLLHRVSYASASPSPSHVSVDVVCANLWIKARAGSVASARLDGDTDVHSSSEDGDSDDDDPPVARDAKVPADPFSSLRIVRQAKALVEAAKQHLFHYKPPTVLICFMMGNTAIDTSSISVADLEPLSLPELDPMDALLVDTLTAIGVHVCLGLNHFKHVVQQTNSSIVNYSSTPSTLPLHPSFYLAPLLNLDISTLISLVSDICHRFPLVPNHLYDVHGLQIQQTGERARPLLPRLLRALEGRQLVVTRMAFTRFLGIADKIAGPLERARVIALFDRDGMVKEDMDALARITATDGSWKDDLLREDAYMRPLVRRIKVVPDAPSDRFLQLLTDGKTPPLERRSKGKSNRQQSGKSVNPSASISPLKLSEINVAIFGTGDALRATTITANEGLVRSFEMHLAGVSVFLHEPRSLIEARKGGY